MAYDQQLADAEEKIRSLEIQLNHFHTCEDYANEMNAANKTFREALEMIAGKRQCPDNLMSNKEIALAVLENTTV